MIYVGIDTGVNTGFAVWDSKQRSLLQVCSLPIHKAMERVRSLYDEYKAGIGDKVIVRVEDPRQRTWFGTERMSREMERKKLQGVGSVKRDASIWDDYLKELGVEYEMVAPKRNVTKLTQERFKALTGWQKQTNGVYDADPKFHPEAKMFTHLSYNDVLQKKLEVMDNTAITLCMNNKIPIMVFNIDVPGNIVKACEGENLGTLIEEK